MVRTFSKAIRCDGCGYSNFSIEEVENYERGVKYFRIKCKHCSKTLDSYGIEMLKETDENE